MNKMSTVELQIAERARKFKGEALHNLHHYIDEALLHESYKKLNQKSAEGIDGKTWLEYGKEFPERRESLLAEFKSGRYKAPALRRVYIPKDKYSQRPIDIAKSIPNYTSSQRGVGICNNHPSFPSYVWKRT